MSTSEKQKQSATPAASSASDPLQHLSNGQEFCVKMGNKIVPLSKINKPHNVVCESQGTLFTGGHRPKADVPQKVIDRLNES